MHQSNISTAYIVQQGELWVAVTPYRIEKGLLSPKELSCWCWEEIAFFSFSFLYFFFFFWSVGIPVSSKET